MPKRSITISTRTTGPRGEKVDTTNTNKRQRTTTTTKYYQENDEVGSSIDCAPPPRSPSSMSTPGRHNFMPELPLLPESDHRHRHHRVSEVVSDVSSVDHSIPGRSRANSDDCIPIPAHVTTATKILPVTSVARPVSSTGSGSGIFFEGRELPPTSPINGGALLDSHDDKEVIVPTFFDTNKVVAHTSVDGTNKSSEQQQQQEQGVVYDLVPSSLRSRATAFTPLLPSPVLLNRSVASYLVKEHRNVDENNDNTSMNGGASVDSSISKGESTTKANTSKASEEINGKTRRPATISLQLDQYAIHMKSQRLRSYLKKRAAERRAIRRAENERNSGRTTTSISAHKSSTGIVGSANRSAAGSPITDMGADVPQTGIKLQLPRPVSSYTSITTTDPPGLPSTVSYDTATDASTNVTAATATNCDQTSSLNESAPLSACSQDVLDAAVALTRCLTTKNVS